MEPGLALKNGHSLGRGRWAPLAFCPSLSSYLLPSASVCEEAGHLPGPISAYLELPGTYVILTSGLSPACPSLGAQKPQHATPPPPLPGRTASISASLTSCDIFGSSCCRGGDAFACLLALSCPPQPSPTAALPRMCRETPLHSPPSRPASCRAGQGSGLTQRELSGMEAQGLGVRFKASVLPLWASLLCL